MLMGVVVLGCSFAMLCYHIYSSIHNVLHLIVPVDSLVRRWMVAGVS